MTPIAKFHSYVVAITVGIMFVVLKTAVQLGPVANLHPLAAPFLAGLSSLGVYRLTASLILTILPKWNWLFKFTLGPYYLKGTWGGYVLTKTGKTRLIVEKYEQTLSNISVAGWSFSPDRALDANWTTESAQISPVRGELLCFYKINVPYKDKLVEALGRLQFDRASELEGPTKMTGYTVDTDATQKLRYDDLHKLSDQLLELDIAVEKTFERYKDRIDQESSSELSDRKNLS